MRYAAIVEHMAHVVTELERGWWEPIWSQPQRAALTNLRERLSRVAFFGGVAGRSRRCLLPAEGERQMRCSRGRGIVTLGCLLGDLVAAVSAIAVVMAGLR